MSSSSITPLRSSHPPAPAPPKEYHDCMVLMRLLDTRTSAAMAQLPQTITEGAKFQIPITAGQEPAQEDIAKAKTAMVVGFLRHHAANGGGAQFSQMADDLIGISNMLDHAVERLRTRLATSEPSVGTSGLVSTGRHTTTGQLTPEEKKAAILEQQRLRVVNEIERLKREHDKGRQQQ